MTKKTIFDIYNEETPKEKPVETIPTNEVPTTPIEEVDTIEEVKPVETKMETVNTTPLENVGTNSLVENKGGDDSACNTT